MTKKRTSVLSAEQMFTFLTPILGILIGLLLTAFLLASQGVNPLAAYASMFKGALGGKTQISFTFMEFIPLGLAGLAVTLAYRCGTFNIGVEGQLYMAALFTTWVAVSCQSLPGIILLPLCIAAGVVAAGLMAAIPAYLKVRHGMNEILICMLLNYVGTNMVGLAVNSFLKAPDQPYPNSEMLPQSTWLPVILKDTQLHIGLVFVFILAVVMYFALFKTTLGYRIRSVGLSRKASLYSGINVSNTMIWSMVLSGMIAGLAGIMVILGSQHRLLNNFLVGYGYDAISVSILGGIHPIGVLFTAFLFGVLKSGGNAMQISAGIPVSVVSMITAVAILSIIALTQLRKRYFKKGGSKA